VAAPGNTPFLETVCDIDQLDAEAVLANTDQFLQDYVLRRRPVLVRNWLAADPAVSHYARQWKRKTLLKAFGSTLWKVASIPYSANYLRQQPSEMTLREFVRANIDGARRDRSLDASGNGRNEEGGSGRVDSDDSTGGEGEGNGEGVPNYIFASWFQPGSRRGPARDITANFSSSPSFMRSFEIMHATQLYLGPPGSGAPWHYHHAAWNLLGYGKKAWLVVPPKRAAFSSKSARQCFRDDAPMMEDNGSHPVWRCVQQAGDLIVMPEGWAHTTYNLRTSIGIAREFLEMSIFQ
jgi:hypothetical protein